jgi:hypothetical protein
MTTEEARHWIDSYNAWVAKWNANETAPRGEWGPNPIWEEADNIVSYGPGERSVLMFQISDEKVGRIKLNRKWTHFEPGLFERRSFCRVPADPSMIVWAHWVSATLRRAP